MVGFGFKNLNMPLTEPEYPTEVVKLRVFRIISIDASFIFLKSTTCYLHIRLKIDCIITKLNYVFVISLV
jgi:hypothetical protein